MSVDTMSHPPFISRPASDALDRPTKRQRSSVDDVQHLARFHSSFDFGSLFNTVALLDDISTTFPTIAWDFEDVDDDSSALSTKQESHISKKRDSRGLFVSLPISACLMTGTKLTQS